MLVISRTLRLGCLAFRNGCGIPYSSTLVLRPAAQTLPHPLVTPLSPLSQILVRCCSSRGLSMSGGDVGDTTGGSSSADGGLIQPRVPVSSITAFGQGLGQEQLQVRTGCNKRKGMMFMFLAECTAADTAVRKKGERPSEAAPLFCILSHHCCITHMYVLTVRISSGYLLFI